MTSSQKLPKALAVLLASAGLAACGAGTAPSISADAAKATVERAAHIQLESFSLPDGAREQGLTSAFTNTPTAGDDGQAVAVFLAEDAGVVDEVRDDVRRAVPEPSELLVKGNVMVVYASAGTDRYRQVAQAVSRL